MTLIYFQLVIRGYNENERLKSSATSTVAHLPKIQVLEKTLKIAIVTDDHRTISAHFGRAQFYEIFTLEAGRIISRETIARSFPQALTVGAGHAPEGEQPHHDHHAMLAPIADCEALLSRGMGRGAHLSLQENDIQPIITEILEIQAAVEAYLAGTLVDHPELLH